MPALSEEELGEEELFAERIGAFEPRHLRRGEAIPGRLRGLVEEERNILQVGQLNINFEKKRVGFHDKVLPLTAIQFKLIGSLALNADPVMGYQELLQTVWGYEGDDSEGRELLKVHTNRIRQKMRAIAQGGQSYIQSVRGFRYMLSPPDG